MAGDNIYATLPTTDQPAGSDNIYSTLPTGDAPASAGAALVPPIDSNTPQLSQYNPTFGQRASDLLSSVRRSSPVESILGKTPDETAQMLEPRPTGLIPNVVKAAKDLPAVGAVSPASLMGDQTTVAGGINKELLSQVNLDNLAMATGIGELWKAAKAASDAPKIASLTKALVGAYFSTQGAKGIGQSAGEIAAGGQTPGQTGASIAGIGLNGLMAFAPAGEALMNGKVKPFQRPINGKNLNTPAGALPPVEPTPPNAIQPPQPPVEAAAVAQPPKTEATDQALPQPAGQGTPPSPPPEATAANQPVLQPALKIGDKIYTGGGNKHVQIAMAHSEDDPSILENYAENHGSVSGFVDPKNPSVFLSRADAAKTGVFGDQAAQSENLPGFDENGTPPPKLVTDAATPDIHGGAQEDLPAAQQAKSVANNSPDAWAQMRAATEAAKKQSPTAAAGEVTPKNAPEQSGLAAPVQSGGNRSVTGLAARVRDEREAAGQTDPTQPGKGIAPEASVERGRQLVQSGADPESVMQQFEKTNRVSSDDFAVARAHTENLARATNEAEDKFGRDSKEFKDAYKTESDWAARTKAMQTEWAKSGHAQQGEVDIDTGSFSGLKRAYRDSHNGEEMPAKDEKKAQALADENKKLAGEKADLMKRLSAAIDNETAPKIEPHVRLIADKLKGFFETSAKSALDRIKARRAEGRLFAGIDPTELADYATYGASKILSKGIEGAEMSADWAKEMTQEIGDFITPHLKQIWDASKKALDFQLKKVAGAGTTAKKVKDAVAATVEKPAISPADQKALDAANKTVREAAASLAKAETDASVLQSGKNKKASNEQIENARKAVEAANKTVREAAARAAELENKKRIAEAAKKQVPGTIEHTRTEFFRYKGGEMDGDQVRALWNYAKKNYIDKGNDNFTDIVNKVSTDLGLKFKDVADGLSQPKAVRKITDELWRKQTDARRVSENAKRWVQSQNTPLLGQTIPRVARLMFGLKVAGHGGVAFGTHAPMVAFMPKYTKAYLRDFGKMYKMVFSTPEYEKNVQALRADPNYTTAQRAGLVNDPYKVEDFNNPNMAQILGNTGKLLGKIAGGGNRGYFALKVLRQDMFNQGWNKLPESIKSPEMAKAMADDINHITGVVKGSGGNKASLALFAPRLLMSRAAFLVGDPYKAVEIASTAMSPAKWKALPPEQKFQVINQVKQKATILAVAYGLLKANQAVLSATGSNQKINTTDPTKSDFMKFKIAGMDFSYGNAMLNMARLPVRLWTIGAGDGGKLKKVIYPDESMYSAAGEFARSQASPLASLGLDLLFKGDYQNRPLPQIPGYGKPIPIPKRLAAQGIKPYTWPEFFAEQVSPIPFEEAEREIWRTGFGLSHEQMKSLAKAAGTTIVMMGTGGRLTEDIQPKSKQPTSRFKQ